MADKVILKFDPAIEGEAKQDQFEGGIDIASFSLGVARAASLQDLQADTLGSAPSYGLSLTKNSDKASALMWKAFLEGTRFKNATVYVLRNTKDGTETSFELELDNVVISTMDFSATQGGPERGMESFSLVAAKMKGRAEKQDFTWDFLANKA